MTSFGAQMNPRKAPAGDLRTGSLAATPGTRARLIATGGGTRTRFIVRMRYAGGAFPPIRARHDGRRVAGRTADSAAVDFGIVIVSGARDPPYRRFERMKPA